ncbi:Sec-independent protein translocase subunit TatA [Prescottella subtropica]|uniref:Sec-independent protein translocase subunit TatA n=1 Tax=Prescottella subtropica TaxID=2545757 RepID=UPI0010F740FB|nr:Sec-independent protein translocase subunit TatA [Prescottella subtropica]
MGSLSIWHWAIVALVVVILFGSKKLPEAARGLGRSLRIFKSEVKEMQNDGNPPSTATEVTSSAQLSSPIDATVVDAPQPRTEPKTA